MNTINVCFICLAILMPCFVLGSETDAVDTLLQDEDSNFEENPKETKRFNEMFSRSLRSQQHSAGPLEMWTRSLRGRPNSRFGRSDPSIKSPHFWGSPEHYMENHPRFFYLAPEFSRNSRSSDMFMRALRGRPNARFGRSDPSLTSKGRYLRSDDDMWMRSLRKKADDMWMRAL